VWRATCYHVRRRAESNSMRCFICDVELTEGEISLDRELKSNPCTTCNQIIYEAAYGKSLPNYDDEYADEFEPDDEAFAEMIEDEILSERT
jgi:hypothetical protein